MHKALTALVLALLASPAAADTLIDNANGIQVGADGRLQRFTGLLIGDDGKVVRTLAAGEARPRADAIVDAGGRTLLPGLIDAHGHVIDAPGGDMGLGLLVLQLDLTGTKSVEELKHRLAAHAAANPGSGWILGRGWNEELWTTKRYPTAADLDAVVADRPVLLARVDGHASVANGAALKAAGLDSRTPDPSDSKIERKADRSPTGVLIDNAIQLVAGRAPPPSAEMMDQALDSAQAALLATGVTAVADMGSSPLGWQAMTRSAGTGRLKVRIVSYFDGLQPAQSIPVIAPTEWLHGDRLRMVGFKIYGDGALGSRGALLKQPYRDRPETRGLSLLAEAAMQTQASAAAAAGFQIAIHAIGDAANAQAISVHERLARQYGRDRRGRIEHFQIADPADIPRLAPAGIIASMQPTHQTSDRTMAEARLGTDRLAGAYAWQSVLRSGARLAFGSDFPVESPNPFPGLAAAVSRQDMNGQPPGGWLPHERVSFTQALAGFTRDAAYAGFAEDRIGSLEPGKWADFIIVDRDISTVAPIDIGRTQVLETWVGGRKLWERDVSAAGERG